MKHLLTIHPLIRILIPHNIENSLWYYATLSENEYGQPVKSQKVGISEFFATFIENRVRAEMGCPLRTYYSIFYEDNDPKFRGKQIDTVNNEIVSRFVDKDGNFFYKGLPKGIPVFVFKCKQ